MIYALSLMMFAALGGFIASFMGGLMGTLPAPSALLGALASCLFAWGCAGVIDRMERDGRC